MGICHMTSERESHGQGLRGFRECARHSAADALLTLLRISDLGVLAPWPEAFPRKLRNLDHVNMRQTFLYRAASTSDPFLGLADGRTRPEPLRSLSLFGRGSDVAVLKEEVSSESRSLKTWRDLDAIGGPPPALCDVKLIGMGGEFGVLGVSRVFNIIRSIDFVRKGPAGLAAGADPLVSAAAAAATGIDLGSRESTTAAAGRIKRKAY